MSPIRNHDPLIAWQRLRAASEGVPVPAAVTAADDSPAAVVFRCADSGVPSESVFNQSPGSLLETSTWGHMVDAGVLATLEYAVDKLDVPLIVVLGHRDCHAMRTALRAWNQADMPDGAARMMVEQAMGSIVRRGAGADSAEAIGAAHIVETGLGLLERSPVIARRVDSGRCGIVCAAATTGGRIRVYATVGEVGEVSDALLECV